MRIPNWQTESTANLQQSGCLPETESSASSRGRGGREVMSTPWEIQIPEPESENEWRDISVGFVDEVTEAADAAEGE